MKTLSLLLILCTLAFMTGCHSDTVRGAGKDVEALGQSLQK